MDSCSKHGNVQCRFFCTTCSVPVCHVCMERGDHVIPNHQCIPMRQYCEKKSNEIRDLLHGATQHKTKYDQIKLKWDTHLSSLEGEFGKLKTEIRLTKQNLLQQMDLAEQSLLKTAGIAKTRKETAVKSTKESHEKRFSGTYHQLVEKCQSLLRKLSNQIIGDEHAFQECHNLLNTLQEDLTNFDKEDLLGINFTFVPSKTCYLGEVIAPKDADYILGSTLKSPKRENGEQPAQKKRKTTDNDTESPQIKQEHKDPYVVSNDGNKPSSDIKTEPTSTSGFNGSSHVTNPGSTSIPGSSRSVHSVTANASTSKATHNMSSSASFQSPNASCTLPPRSPTQKSLNEKGGLGISAKKESNALLSVNNLQVINVDSQCCGIVWADNDWLFEILTTQSFITIKQHKTSDLGLLQSSMNIKCNQSMEGVGVYVCPKLYPPDYSLVLGFNDQVAIIRLKGSKEVTWRKIPNQFSIKAISWGKDPSSYVAIVKGPGGKVSLIKDVARNSGKPEFEVRDLSKISFQLCHPFDISSNSEFAICNTLSNRILYFSSLSEPAPTKEVVGPPCLIDAKPVSLLVKDDQKEWIALWKGLSPSDKRLKWAIVRYNVNFIPLATVTEYKYTNSYDEPKAFSVCGNKLAVLHNNLRIVFHHGLSTMSK